jgi:hypothetical protein
MSDESNGKCPEKFFGKYRGTVINNVDPLMIGRVMVIVPDVSSLIPSTWAMPCLPTGGLQSGIFTVPLIGAGVWVEFEQGDLDYPLWTGVFFGSAAEVPLLAKLVPPGVPGITLQTPLQSGIVISDVPGPTGGIMLRSGLASIIVNATGIYIQNGAGASIVMTGPAVTINTGALVIT